jgi:hypothetical protein
LTFYILFWLSDLFPPILIGVKVLIRWGVAAQDTIVMDLNLSPSNSSQSRQGAVKHGRGNRDSAPDPCVMHRPLYTLRTKIFKTNMAGESELSFPCSGTQDDVLVGINDVQEDENKAADNISELPKSLNWITGGPILPCVINYVISLYK